MKKYDTYKDSKLRFNGKIPLEWDEAKIKHYFEIGRGRVISQLELKKDGIYPVFSSQTKNDGCMGYIDTYDFDEHQLTWTTDGANAGEVFERIGRYNCTNVCGTLKPKKNLSIRFFLYQLQYLTKFYKRPDTNGAKIMNNEMAEIHCLIPSLIEQKTIASFLDHKTTQIDTLIEKKEQLVEKLTLKRQAIINEAVTKGLNPDVPMKDSGIEWLGEIPEHWEVKKLKHIKANKPNAFVDGPFGSNLKSEHYIENGQVYVIESGFITSGKFEQHKEFKTISKEHFKTIERSSCEGGDVIIAKIGANYGTSGILPKLDKPAVVSGNSLKFSLDTENNNIEYFHYYLGFIKSSGTLELIVNATAQPALSLGLLNEVHIPIPKLSEQNDITNKLNSKMGTIDLILDNLELSIKKLKLYRQSLISEAVTGKIDLRDWKQTDNK